MCRYHSITRAAKELFISQPTISLALKDLEKEFNLQLFHHGKNKISLTKDGEHFYEYAFRLVSESQDMYNRFSALGQSIRPVRIGIPPLLSTIFFPRMIDAFHESSEIPVELSEYGSVRACQMVSSGELDLALVNLDFYNVDNFQYHVLMEDTTIYLVSRNHPFADEKEVGIEQLKDESVIFYNTDSVQNQMITARYHSIGVSPKVLLHSSQLYTTLNFVRGGNCGAFLYSSIAVNPRDFVPIPIVPEITTRFGILWRKGAMPRHAQSFVDFAKGYDVSSFI